MTTADTAMSNDARWGAGGLLTTSAAARLLGVGPTTIKRWADEGRLVAVKTVGGHRRIVRESADRMLRQDRIHTALAPVESGDLFGERWAGLLLEEVEPRRIQAALLKERARLGSWWRVADFVGEVIDQLGTLWETGAVTVAEEHVASNGLTRAISACAAAIPSNPQAPRALLCSVEGELHTLGIHLVELTLHEAGWGTLWLGGYTPGEVLMDALDRYHPELVAISASAWSSKPEQLAFLHARIAEACRTQETALVVGGRGAWPAAPGYGVRLFSFEELQRHLNRFPQRGGPSNRTGG